LVGSSISASDCGLLSRLSRSRAWLLRLEIMDKNAQIAATIPPNTIKGIRSSKPRIANTMGETSQGIIAGVVGRRIPKNRSGGYLRHRRQAFFTPAYQKFRFYPYRRVSCFARVYIDPAACGLAFAWRDANA